MEVTDDPLRVIDRILLLTATSYLGPGIATRKTTTDSMNLWCLLLSIP